MQCDAVNTHSQCSYTVLIIVYFLLFILFLRYSWYSLQQICYVCCFGFFGLLQCCEKSCDRRLEMAKCTRDVSARCH